MKTTPIYILLIIFFLNFDFAWGLVPAKYDTYLLQGYYAVQKDKETFHSINLCYDLGGTNFKRNDKFHSLRLNIGISNILTELDYNLGYRMNINNSFEIDPYISSGLNVYSFAYGAGFELQYILTGSWRIIANVNYRTTEKLFGNTDAQQWYQKGVGFKIGVELNHSVFVRAGVCQEE